MRIIIAGYRHYNNYKFVEEQCISIINEWYKEFKTKPIIVSGKEPNGVDKLGEEFAAKYGFKVHPYYANWALGLSGGPVRNTEMANNADCLIAFPSKDSKGTRDMIRKAIAKGLKVKVIEI